MKKQLMWEMTTEEVRNYLKTGNRVLVPIGSTEEHGPHLPLCTDTLIATEVAKRLALRLNALVSTPVGFGNSMEHKGFPGLVTLRPTTLLQLVGDIVVSLAHDGFRKIIFINGHGTNDSLLYYAFQEVYERLPPKTLVFHLSYWKGLQPGGFTKKGEYLGEEVGVHANVGETSVVLRIDPKLVQMDKAVKEFPNVPKQLITDSVTTLVPILTATTGGWKNYSKSGVWGDATASTPEKGEAFLQRICDGLVGLIEDIEKTHDEGFTDEGGKGKSITQ
jgi:creatinine amidohydrolase